MVPVGTTAMDWWCPAISLCWSCRLTARSSIQWSGFGTICAATGSPTIISTIRLWGVLADYRRSGRHRRSSKALVRHSADAGLALAAVLGVPAEDIRVREGADGLLIQPGDRAE